MGLAGLLKGLGDAFQGFMTNKKIDNNLQIALRFAAGLTNLLQQAVAGSWWALERIREGAENDRGSVVHTGSQFGRGLAELRICLRHVMDTIIPNTVGNAVGYTFSHGIVPLRVENKSQWDLIYGLEDEASTLIRWRTNRVDPFLGDLTRLAGWIGGLENFPNLPGANAKDWIALLAELIHQWDALPAFLLERGGDARGTGLSRVVGWLSEPAHQGGFDDLLAVLIDGSPDRYRHIIQATETILASPYP